MGFKSPSDLHERSMWIVNPESLSHFVSDFLHPIWNPDFWQSFCSGTTVPVAIQNPRMRASVVLTTLWQLSRCWMPWRERFSSPRWMRCRVREGLCLVDQATASERYIFVYGEISRVLELFFDKFLFDVQFEDRDELGRSHLTILWNLVEMFSIGSTKWDDMFILLI